MSLLWRGAALHAGKDFMHEDFGPYIDRHHTGGGRITVYQYGDVEPRGVLSYIHASPMHLGIDNIAVRADSRRQGYGSALLDHLRDLHPGKGLVTEDLSADGHALNEAYGERTGDKIQVLNPGSWQGSA